MALVKHVLNTYLLVEKIEETTTKSGLHLSASESGPCSKGRVVAVAENIVDLKEGMTVAFPAYDALKIYIEDKEYWAVKAEDLIAVL